MLVYSDKIFKNPIETITAFDKQSFVRAFERIEELRDKYYIVGYIKYEAYKIFQKTEISSKMPLLFFEVFERFEPFTPQMVRNFKVVLYPEISKAQYLEKIDYIKKQIAQGNTYEVNYTIPHTVWASTEGFELFNALIARQKTPYNAYIKNDYEEVLSFSPELFFRVDNGRIYTKPMKGTIKRGLTEDEDEANKTFLRNDEKNRAENVMIVDLLRNDLGRIAKTGTVKTDKLFEIETHKTLHQMTSEISAELIDGIKLYDIFKAIFPCGSITGAPKISTMKIIEDIELQPRNIYCGALGIIHGDRCEFSVPIRILQRELNSPFYTCHTGGAIVWDSEDIDEWDEAVLKRSFLRGDIEPARIDTIAVRNGKVLFEKEHLERINYLIPDSLKHEDAILRLKMTPNGDINREQLPLNTIITNKITFSDMPVSSQNPYIYVKTDFRPWYENSMGKIARGEVFDEIYFNERAELTEGARSNIILKKNGKLYTPPIHCGLLNGIYRKRLLKKGHCVEKILYKKDVLEADEIYCCNSVRGMVKVCLL